MNRFQTYIITGIITGITLGIGCTEKTNAKYNGPQLQTGDIVFRRGNGTKSRAVTFTDNNGIYSHVGIAITTDSGTMIIHAVPGENDDDSIKADKLTDFFARDKAIQGEVMRLKTDTSNLTNAANYALRKLTESVKFDHDYDLNDTTFLYCTEFIWRAFLQSDLDITQGRRSEIVNMGSFSGKYIFPSDISRHYALISIYKF